MYIKKVSYLILGGFVALCFNEESFCAESGQPTDIVQDSMELPKTKIIPYELSLNAFNACQRFFNNAPIAAKFAEYDLNNPELSKLILDKYLQVRLWTNHAILNKNAPEEIENKLKILGNNKSIKTILTHKRKLKDKEETVEYITDELKKDLQNMKEYFQEGQRNTLRETEGTEIVLFKVSADSDRMSVFPALGTDTIYGKDRNALNIWKSPTTGKSALIKERDKYSKAQKELSSTIEELSHQQKSLSAKLSPEAEELSLTPNQYRKEQLIADLNANIPKKATTIKQHIDDTPDEVEKKLTEQLKCKRNKNNELADQLKRKQEELNEIKRKNEELNLLLENQKKKIESVDWTAEAEKNAWTNRREGLENDWNEKKNQTNMVFKQGGNKQKK